MYIAGKIPCGVSQDPLRGLAGLGCSECNGTCGGMGLLESGFDWSQWGWQDWLTVAGIAYTVFSLFATTQRGARTVRKAYRRRRAA